MNIKGGEISNVETHACGTTGNSSGEVCSGPVKHGHEIVADGFYTGGCEIFQALLVVGDVSAPVALVFLDVLGDRQAFDDFPGKARGSAVGPSANLGLTLGDLLGGPDGPIGNV